VNGAGTSDALVIFGVTGDLAYRQIFPALHAMIRRGQLDAPILGMARAGSSLEALRERARQSVAEHGDVDPAAFATLSARLQYVGGNYEDASTFEALRADGDATGLLLRHPAESLRHRGVGAGRGRRGW
jgi:glucose-6-phosphate 1-dehydrogenase